MILTGRQGLSFIDGDPQVNGVDVKVTNVYQLIEKDLNDKVTDEYYLPLESLLEMDQDTFCFDKPYTTITSTTKTYWELWPGQAVLFELGPVDLFVTYPEYNVNALVLPKSRFLRCGITVDSAFWDCGYRGRGKVLVINHSQKIHKIYKNMYFGQMIFFESQKGDMVYSGTHQGEGLK